MKTSWMKTVSVAAAASLLVSVSLTPCSGVEVQTKVCTPTGAGTCVLNNLTAIIDGINYARMIEMRGGEQNLDSAVKQYESICNGLKQAVSSGTMASILAGFGSDEATFDRVFDLSCTLAHHKALKAGARNLPKTISDDNS